MRPGRTLKSYAPSGPAGGYLPASMLAGVPFEVAYPAIAWLCWVPNLLVVEWLLRRQPTDMASTS